MHNADWLPTFTSEIGTETMPHRVWKHRCRNQDYDVWMGRPICDSCGQHGEFDGWMYGRVEAMCAYQRRTGLKPIGPHRKYAAELFGMYMWQCEECSGRGIVAMDEGDTYQVCVVCDGACSIFNGDDETKRHIQSLVLQAFPDAM